jgi:hypothetical protein
MTLAVGRRGRVARTRDLATGEGLMAGAGRLPSGPGGPDGVKSSYGTVTVCTAVGAPVPQGFSAVTLTL